MPNWFWFKKEKWLDSVNLLCYFNPLILAHKIPPWRALEVVSNYESV
jgi:hypothetical protein